MTERVVQEAEGKQNCIVALADIAENSLDVFSGSIVPLFLGALLLFLVSFLANG